MVCFARAEEAVTQCLGSLCAEGKQAAADGATLLYGPYVRFEAFKAVEMHYVLF
jgi:hypothetical protein